MESIVADGIIVSPELSKYIKWFDTHRLHPLMENKYIYFFLFNHLVLLSKMT